MSLTRLRIIEPAGTADPDALARNMARLRTAGFSLAWEPSTRDPQTPMSAASDAERARTLQHALTEPDSDVVVAARGGYGASSLLTHLDWDAIGAAEPKMLIGFSDICVLHSAMLTALGRAGLHGPMPGSALYGQHNEDIEILQRLLTQGLPFNSELEVAPLQRDADSASGWLFGGNLAALTNLIGTPWFPSSLHDSIVFLEDVGEHAGRTGRYFNQWCQSGAMDGVRAIVLGQFIQSGEGNAGKRENIVNEISRRVDCPVFETMAFGHVSPNYPLAIGASASIAGGKLRWHLSSLRPFA